MQARPTTLSGALDPPRLDAVGAMTAILVLLAGFLLDGCSAASPPLTSAPAQSRLFDGGAAVDHLEEHALLLLISDRRTFEGVTLGAALKASPQLRRQAARALGQIGDRRGSVVLQRLLADRDLSVRRTAAFALGELGEKLAGAGGSVEAVAAALLGVAIDEDRETGILAIEALAKLGVTVETVVERLIAGASSELLPRLLPSLFRFQSRQDPSPAVVRWSLEGLQEGDASLHAMAAYALARTPLPEGAAALRELLADADPWVRGWAARGLGEVGERADVERLVALFDDSEPGPIIQALRALRQLIDAGRAAPPYEAKPRLLELMDDPRPGIRLTAIDAAAAWLLDDDIGRRLARFASDGHPRERRLAILALARGDDSRALEALAGAARHGDPAVRRSAAQAAGLLGAVEVLDLLAADRAAPVRATALATWLIAEPPDAVERVSTALADADAGVRASAFEWLAEHPEVGIETLVAGLEKSRRDRIVDARLAAVDALAARADAVSLERGALMAILENLASDEDLLVRRQASAALAALDGERIDPGGLRLRKSVNVYREIARRTARPIRVDLRTERGNVQLELACPEAPLTCLNFLQLGTQGFFDELPFHRVVPDFVVQAGDPRGDGRGGPGYTIRDEINLLRFDRGAVGMALSGPDTGGSQFFVTLSPQPHLDGGYTVFGRVVSGLGVLDEILEGDRILSIAEVSAP